MSHLHEIDRAVALARRAATSGLTPEPRRLTRLLHRTWYLGTAAQRPVAPSARVAPWRAWGPQWEPRTTGRSDLVRLSLCCAPHTSLHAVATAVTRLRDWDVPWLLSSRAVGRSVATPDSTALYVPADALADLRGPVRDLVAELQPFLASGIPALTLRIGRGAALAQTPGDGRPYGEHRCSLVAHAVLANLDQPHRVVVERTLTAFRLAQVDPGRPYRALGATWEWEGRRLSAA